MRQIRGESKSLRMKIPEKRSNVGHSYLVALVILAAMCVGLDAFLVFRHWKTLSSREILLLAVPIGLQCAGQIWRLFRYRKAVEMITAEDFRDFVFTNPVKLWTSVNPDFFKGTAVESAVNSYLAQS